MRPWLGIARPNGFFDGLVGETRPSWSILVGLFHVVRFVYCNPRGYVVKGIRSGAGDCSRLDTYGVDAGATLEGLFTDEGQRSGKHHHALKTRTIEKGLVANILNGVG